MSYAAILVYVEADGYPEQRVAVAAALARHFDAALIGLAAHAVPPPFVAEGVIIEEATEDDKQAMRDRLEKKGAWFRRAAGSDVPELEWRAALDFPGDALLDAARCADLIVTGPTDRRRDYYRTLDSRAALFSLGRPVLVVPENVASIRHEHVVVGWKDTRESRRAIRDALPFLKSAKRVSVVEICGDERVAATKAVLEDVVRYLARHGITATAQPVVHRDRSHAEHLLQFAYDEAADLLVSGAYGHSRLGEWVFGGVTRELLDASALPCLMAH